MKYLVASVAFLFLSSCASFHKNSGSEERSFKEFQTIKDIPILKAKWGDPVVKKEIAIGGQTFSLWEYNDDANKTVAEFLVNPKNEMSEKVFLPDAKSSMFNLQYLLANEFKDAKFEKIPVKCRHFNEVIYVDRLKGVILVTRDMPDANVDAISISTPNIVDLRTKENAHKKCR